MASEPMDMSKKIFSGKYEIQELIAKGGMGEVYKAWDIQLETAVALKVVHPHLCSDQEFLTRFRDEARKTARLRGHENIVQTFSVENDEGTEYLVMEYFPSNNLREEIRINGSLPLREAINVIRQIAHALSYTHARDIIHRDIKPANILLDDTKKVKLTDFGIAKALLEQTPLTATDQLIGTVKYMSPEQAQNKKLDVRTDLYSLGMVFFELITGGNLWKDSANLVILGKLQAESTMPTLDFPSDVPKGIQRVIEDLLQFNPNDRIQNSDTLLSRLDDLPAMSQHRHLRDPARGQEGSEAAAATKKATKKVTKKATKKAGKPRAVRKGASPGASFDETQLTQVANQLAGYIGPLAPILVKRAAKEAKSLDNLYHVLAEDVLPNEEQKRQFLESCRTLH